MPNDPTISRAPNPDDGTFSYDPLDAGLAAAFATEATPGGWSRPPLLREDPSDYSPIVRPDSADMPRGGSNRYQLLGEIARGGMGVVFKGRDPDLGRDLAVKVLKAELIGRGSAEQRFAEEAQVGGQLQHPGIVPVYDLGRFSDGQPFFAMKLVKGRTLATCLAERPDPTHERGRWLKAFEDIAQAVAFAHARGVIHRDLKPANVMIGSFGEVQVMDWGLAKVLPHGGLVDEERANRERQRPETQDEATVIRTLRGSGGSETQAGSVLGTPAFMPPEQAGGEIDKLDERADVFGLGAVLCVILTGQPPYVGETAEAVRLMAVRGQLADAHARLDACGADAELSALAKRCLEPELVNRPRHAKEVANAITAYRESIEQRAHLAEVDRAAAEARAAEEVKTRQMAEAKTQEERKRRRTQFALVASVGLLLLGGGAVGWWADRQAGERRAAAIQKELEDEQRGNEERLRLTRNGDALAALINWCEQALQTEDPDAARDALAEIDRRLPDGGGDALSDRIARCRADLALLRGLDAFDRFRWTYIGTKLPDSQDLVNQLRDVFKAAGLGIGELSTAELDRRVNASHLRERLLGALDLWHVRQPTTDIREVLRAIDPDTYRETVRDAILNGREQRYAELANQADAISQPARFTVAICESAAIPEERRRTLLQVALRSQPGKLSILMGLGTTYRINQSDGAAERIRWYQSAVAAHPKNGLAHNNLGIALLDKRELDGAVAAFRETMRLAPEMRFVRNNLGNALIQTGELDAAIAILKEEIRINPSYANGYNTLGNAHRKKKEFEPALAAFRDALRLDQNLALAHYNLGACLLETRQVDASIAAFEKAIALDPKFAPAHFGLGNGLMAKNNWHAAIAAFKESVRLDEKAPYVYFPLSGALWRAGAVREAATAMGEAVALNPENAQYHKFLGMLLQTQPIPDVAGAIAAYKKAVQLNPKDAIAHSELANLLATGPDGVRDGKQAVEYGVQACELSGWKNQLCIQDLAAAYAEVGDFNKAVEYQKKALALPATKELDVPGAHKRLALYERKQPYRDLALTPREKAPPPRPLK